MKAKLCSVDTAAVWYDFSVHWRWAFIVVDSARPKVINVEKHRGEIQAASNDLVSLQYAGVAHW